MANGEFLDALSESAFTDIKKYNSEILEIIKNVSKVREQFNGITMPSQSSDAIKKINIEYLKQEEVLKKIELANNKLADAQSKSNPNNPNNNGTAKETLRQLELETKNRQALDKQREKSLQLQEKEIKALDKISGLYNQTQIKVNEASKIYNNLAIKKELNGKLSANEEIQLIKITKELNTYQSALKKVDFDIQKNQRNVGNYKDSYNALGNSINQLTREAPAFNNSVGTGFMAISNNFPALFDAISQINQKNKELISQGQPVKSLFTELAGSIFSWQTALSVGVTLLTIYGPKLYESISGSKLKKEAIQKEKEAIEEKNKVEQQMSDAQSKYASDEISKSRILLETAKNTTLSYEKRKKAVKELQERYSSYLGNLSQEEILAGKAELAENKLTDALIKRGLYLAVKDRISDVFKKVADAEFESVKNQTNAEDLYSKSIDKKIEKKGKLRMVTEEEINSASGLLQQEEEYQNKQKKGEIVQVRTEDIRRGKIVGLNKELDVLFKLLNANAKYLDVVVETNKNTNDKQKKDLILLNYDYIQSEYELAKAILDRKLAEAGDIANNESLLFKKRIIARQNFSRISIELADLEYEKNIELSKKAQEDDLLKNLETYQKNKENKTLSVKDRQIAEQQYSDNIFSINKDYIAKNETIEINHSEKINQLRNQDLAFFKEIQDKQNDYSLETIKFIADGEKAKLKLIIDNQKLTTATRQEAFEKHTEILKKELELQKLIELEKNPNNQQSTIEHYQNLNAELDNLSKTASPAAEKLKELRKLTEDYISSTSKQFLGQNGFGSLDLFTDMDVNGKSSFENMLENAEGFKEKFAVIFNSIGDVAKEVFSFIQQSSQENFEKEKQQLEEQYTIATAFAGDSAEAKKEIDKQYQAKQKEIRNREAKANKEMAMFNIGISTAQGVISALAQPIPNVPLSILIGVIGAIQLAAVASKEIPKYFKGGVHSGGLGMINDGGGSNYEEIVKTPDGNISQYSGRNLVLDMPKGTEIFTPEQWQNYQLKQLLNGTGVSMSKNTTEIAMFSDLQVNKIVNAVKNMPVSDLNFDNGKFQNHVKNGHQTKINLNARVTFAGENV